jgi:hypothetical protein
MLAHEFIESHTEAMNDMLDVLLEQGAFAMATTREGKVHYIVVNLEKIVETSLDLH